jgi:hypothetical protein
MDRDSFGGIDPVHVAVAGITVVLVVVMLLLLF